MSIGSPPVQTSTRLRRQRRPADSLAPKPRLAAVALGRRGVGQRPQHGPGARDGTRAGGLSDGDAGRSALCQGALRITQAEVVTLWEPSRGHTRRATPSGQTCSAGIACWDGSETADALLGRADLALYGAKRDGRDRSALARPARIPSPAWTTPAGR